MIIDNIVEFYDTPNQSYHEAFEAWRRAYPAGFFLTLNSNRTANLHASLCDHPGSTSWTTSDTGKSLTTKRKICSPSASELFLWASNHGLDVHPCRHCAEPIETELEAASAFATGQELGEALSVLAGIAEEIAHVGRFRRGELRTQALQIAHGICVVCGTDFSQLLDGRGTRILQVHHKRQPSLYDDPQVNSVDDLAVVCANCHCLLHLDPERAMAVEELRALVG